MPLPHTDLSPAAIAQNLRTRLAQPDLACTEPQEQLTQPGRVGTVFMPTRIVNVIYDIDVMLVLMIAQNLLAITWNIFRDGLMLRYVLVGYLISDRVGTNNAPTLRTK